MANEWSKLVKVLEEEAELHGALISCAAEKRGFIVGNDLTSLDALEMTEERLAGRLRGADRERERLSAELAARLGLAGEDVKLGILAERAPEPARSRLQQAGTRLRALVAELAALNGEVGELLQHALLHIDSFFKLIADSLTQTPTYTPETVRGARTPAATVLDQKV